MERGPPPLPPSVIEGVLDVTTVYYIIVETRVSVHPTLLYSSSCQTSATKDTSLPKCRPVATVRPFSVSEEGEQQGQDLTSNSEFEEKFRKQSTFYEGPEEEDEKFINENIEKGSNCDSGVESDSCIDAKFDPSCESREEERVFPSPLQPVQAPSPPSPQPPSLPSQSAPPPPPSETKLALRETASLQEIRDPCSCHRDKLRAAAGKPNKTPTLSTRMMEVYQNGGQCHDGQGCAGEYGGDLKDNNRYKETQITECLDEFLEELQLTHLRDYLRVLGCTCVRDLKLLEEPELNAIQLVSRRRLLKRLESMSLHHEAPPSDCSLDGWLTWYGLTHISGFLNAIGVLTVADMSYLKEEDLELLKPVTRRRILSLYRK